MFMLDKDTCIFVMNHRDEVLGRKFVENASQICISSITHAELCFGVAHSSHVERNAAVLREFLFKLNIQSYSADAGACYGRIRHELTIQGKLIGANNLLIASHALSIAATLVTGNEREFRRVPELEVENWLRLARNN